MKSKFILSAFLCIGFVFSSCSDFLDEINKTGKTEDLVYSTKTSVNGLVASCYGYTRLWYGKEGGFNLTEGGTDLWYNASDCKAIDLVTYKSITPDQAPDRENNNNTLDEYWEAYYAAVNQCNIALKLVKASTLFTDVEQRKLLGEVRFLRAFYYWHMVEIWGPVQLNLEPVENPLTIATRNSEDEIYTQMFEDVQYAIDNIPPSAPSSRVSYWAAKAFKARLALYSASEYGYIQDYTVAATEAQQVIDGLKAIGKDLYTNYSDVWDIKKSSSATNNEFIWAIDYYDAIGDAQSYNFIPDRMKLDANGNALTWSGIIARQARTANRGGGNVMHVTCTPVWQNQTTAHNGASLADVLVRNAGLEPTAKYYTLASIAINPATKVQVDLGYWYVKYGLGYARFAPTRYLVDLFDETKDQRWNGSFRTAWYKFPTLAPKDYGLAACKYPLMSVGTQTDTCLFWSKRPLTASQIAWATNRYKYFDVNWTFKTNGVTADRNVPDRDAAKSYTAAHYMFPMLRKFENTDSKILLPVSTFQDYFSYRDAPVFRISEMYLIVAEALMATDQGTAVARFNELRAKRAITNQDYSVASVDINLILEERAREFVGENIRWFDLKRTNTLASQIQNNTEARDFFMPSKHYLRPIPSVQMNAVSNKDTSTTGEPTVGSFWQNPGY